MSADGSLKVDELSSELPNPALWGSFRVSATEGSRLDLMGWVLGARADVEKIEVVAKGKVVAAAEPGLPRPEVAEEFPDREAAANCGFDLTIEARGKGRSTLELRAALDDGSTAPIGRIQVSAPERRWAGVFRRS
ncbi:MAG TPA: hypothetical protein VFJ53_00420 [Solirubrobacterales bacterium]|nr:hypothetical protein [Solirubrobacterales bacterium]